MSAGVGFEGMTGLETVRGGSVAAHEALVHGERLLRAPEEEYLRVFGDDLKRHHAA